MAGPLHFRPTGGFSTSAALLHPTPRPLRASAAFPVRGLPTRDACHRKAPAAAPASPGPSPSVAAAAAAAPAKACVCGMGSGVAVWVGAVRQAGRLRRSLTGPHPPFCLTPGVALPSAPGPRAGQQGASGCRPTGRQRCRSCQADPERRCPTVCPAPFSLPMPHPHAFHSPRSGQWGWTVMGQFIAPLHWRSQAEEMLWKFMRHTAPAVFRRGGG